MATLKFRNINKIYDNKVQAVFDFNLDVEDKEFIVFVGPSGCGKSTTLRMVAGLEEISSGELYIDDVLVNDVVPKDRDIAMVFQNYALYPHMSVFDNMAFGLKLRKVPKAEIAERVHEAAEILGLEEYLNRKPKQLSGGQRQRVALGRAIVRSPKVFLMDEPLSNLDAKLSVQMRSEIAKIHQRVGATTIYVTHDQTESMTMSSRIFIMKDGYIQQIGTPKEVNNYPANIFGGRFIGSPDMNFFKGRLEDKAFVTEGEEQVKITLTKEVYDRVKNYEGHNIVLGIRPENVNVVAASTKKAGTISMEADVVELLGHELIVYGYVDGQRILLKTSAANDIKVGDVIKVNIDMENIHFFDVDSTNRILEGDAPVAAEEVAEPVAE